MAFAASGELLSPRCFMDIGLWKYLHFNVPTNVRALNHHTIRMMPEMICLYKECNSLNMGI